jgi:hypothetical protein
MSGARKARRVAGGTADAAGWRKSMSERKHLLLLAAVLSTPVVGAADARSSLAEIPVADTKLVAPAAYTQASALAASGGSALDIALAIVGAFSGSTQHIIQINEGSEAPSASRITVVRDGLLDDSVRGERWDIVLERTGAGHWRIAEVRRAWRCRRGAPTDRFATRLCP